MSAADPLATGSDAQQLRDDGFTWTQVADEFRLSVSVVTRLAARYRDHAAKKAAENQLPLFDC